MPTIISRYMDKFRKSGEFYERGKVAIAGGSHMSRAMHPHPVYVNNAARARKWDVDGNELIDYMMGYGSLFLGHTDPIVTEAVANRLSKGTHMGANTELELEWAEQIKRLLPAADRVRFTSSGTEATLLAVRLARSYTGKTKLVKFKEHFHGWHDYVSLQSGINTQLGIPEETLSTVVVLDPNLNALNRYLEQEDDVAAVILEPTGGHWGQFPLPNPEFLEGVRHITAKYNVAMIMDEVICGFRLSRGGAQGKFDIHPDLTTLAKIVSGGLPGGAVAGKEDIMGVLDSKDSSPHLSHPGTFNANPISATAGITTLRLLETEPINKKADAMADRLKDGLRDVLTKMEVSGHVHGVASIVHIALGVECDCGGGICTCPHSHLEEATGPSKSRPLKLAMLNEGVDMMGGIGFMVSAAHHETDIDSTVESFERALMALRADRVV